MDPWSHRIANGLVGNGPDSATLEATLIGPELRFDDERSVAVVGGDFEVAIDDRRVDAGRAWKVQAGCRLRVGGRVRGARAYIAVAGGIDVPPVLGSRATHVASGMGGHDGRALQVGDCLRLGAADGRRWELVSERRANLLSALLRTAASACVAPGGTARVRVLPGPQRERFEDGAVGQLQSAAYRLTAESNRMGFRLDGPTLRCSDDREMLSDATPFGAVQVPRSGQPILLMADRQTTGGYPKLATMITADAGIAGQLAPGDALQFVVCEEDAALTELLQLERVLREVEAMAS
jgi:antagonist of KipI